MSSRGALSKGPSAMREWLLFGVAALLPAVGLGALGLRALRNEEAAVRREASLSVASAAQRSVNSANQQISDASDALQRATIDDGRARPPMLSAWYDAARVIAPACGTPIVVSPAGAMAMPAQREAAHDAHVDHDCVVLAQSLSNGPAQERDRVKRELIATCPEARDDLGRWLWPTLAMDSLARTADADLQKHLILWLDQHASLMRSTEREATRNDLANLTHLDADQRDRVARALRDDAKPSESLSLVIHSDAATRSIRSAQGDIVTWRGSGSIGVLRPLSSGWLVGFVVTRDSLALAVANNAELQARSDMRAEVVTRIDSDRSNNETKAILGKRPSRESLHDQASAPEAVEWLVDGLGIRVALLHPEALAARTSRSEALLAAIAVSGGLVTIALAFVIFSRMRKARRTSELRTSFVAAVSHELRTPIASIRMLAELLEENRVEPDERAEVHEALAKEARRLGETVDRLLGFSRMAADKVVIDRRRARLADPVSSAVARFRERHADITVEEHIDRELEAEIEPAQIELIIDNLLANAKKYAPDGQPYVVRVQRLDSDATISVSDSGPGIEKRHQTRIFEAFERVDDRLHKATEGSGIGLSLVLSAARAHGGDAWVESEPGKGARFVVRIPAFNKSDADRGTNE